MIQGSPEWHEARRGKVTASRVGDIIAKTKSGYSKSRADYMEQLLDERLGVPTESYSNAAMEWGKAQEPTARAVFEYLTGMTVEEVGFVDHPSIAMAGASPDGLVALESILEIKCPNTATHRNYLRSGVVPAKYKPQIQWQLACTGRKFAHFVSFDPRLPDNLIYFHAVMERDDK